MAAAVLVTTKAFTATPLAPRALPALKPNHPNHSRPAPRIVMVASCGSMGSWPKPRRRPSISAATNGGARADVHHNPPGEIHRTQLVQDAAMSPDPMCHRIVHDRYPEQAEEDERFEPLPLGERPRDQGRRDHREHRLIDHERLVGDRRRMVRIRLEADAVQPDPIEAADTNTQAVSPALTLSIVHLSTLDSSGHLAVHRNGSATARLHVIGPFALVHLRQWQAPFVPAALPPNPQLHPLAVASLTW